MIWLVLIAGATLLFFVAFALESGLGSRRIAHLRDLPENGDTWPKVSIIIAARNEEIKIEEALTSVLALDYPDLEIVVVNDRSTDSTGAILSRLASTHARLKVVTLSSLPTGWLGKNFALHQGASEAGGELLLFTDADVIFEPSSLRRGVRFLSERKLDFLTVSPRVIVRSVPLGMFIAAFGLFFAMYARPWRATKPSPRAHVGIGAFNLVRAELYRRAGGHEPIRMRPDDDMKLAHLLKKNGGRQDIVFGRDMLSVEWYSSLAEAVRGLEKNSFSGLNYSITLLVLATIVQLTFLVWPFVALLVTDGLLFVLNAAIVTLILLLIAGMCVTSGIGPPWYALAFPFGVILFLFILWRSSLKAVMRGGIQWRDTFYSLAELRANKM